MLEGTPHNTTGEVLPTNLKTDHEDVDSTHSNPTHFNSNKKEKSLSNTLKSRKKSR